MSDDASRSPSFSSEYIPEPWIAVSEERRSTFSQRITCDFEFDPFELDRRLIIPICTVLGGHQWQLRVLGESEELASFELSTPKYKAEGEIWAKNVDLWISVSRLDSIFKPSRIKGETYACKRIPSSEGYSLNVHSSLVTSARNLELDAPLMPERYRVVIEYRGETSPEVTTYGNEAILASRNPGTYLDRSITDVCLSFPRNRKLWIDSKQLYSISDYFESCLSSDFAEGQVLPPGSDSTQSELSEPLRKKQKTAEDFEDSDEELDELLSEPPSVSTSNGTSLPCQEIPISQTSFVTYRALLVWHQTGFIRFAPLTSSFLRENEWTPIDSYDAVEDLEKAIHKRKGVIAKLVEQDPSLPSPVSPKSIYRLSDFLSIPHLKELALEAYSSRLTPHGAVHELLSKDSACYPELRKTILDYIAENPQAVIASYRYDKWSQEAKRGSSQPELFIQLFEAVSTLFSNSDKSLSPKKDHANHPVAGVFFP